MNNKDQIARNKSLGTYGEVAAEKYLVQKGLVAIERNFYARGGEIDLVMKDPKDDVYIMIEVKTRKSNTFGSGIDSVTPLKVKKIMKAATSYFLKKLKLREVPIYQIDVVCLEIKDQKISFEHFENVGFEGW